MTRKLALLALLLAACSGESSPSSTEHKTEIPPIEDSPVWMLEDDGSWTCVGEPDVCDGATPPEPLGAP